MKLTQKFGSDETNSDESASTKNAFFTIQADYTNNRYTFADANHGDNLFHYGYVGKFKHQKLQYSKTGLLLIQQQDKYLQDKY